MAQLVFECLNFSKLFDALTISDIWTEASGLGISPQNSYLTHNGKILQSTSNTIAPQKGTIRILPRLRGGKGGFGSMLRAIGAQIEKTTNREACRDLSGRRLKDINEEKRLREWLEKQKVEPEDPSEVFTRKISKLLAKPKHEFKDEAYFKQMSDMTENIDEAVEKGFQKYVQNEEKEKRGIKRSFTDRKGNLKKLKGAVFTGLEELSSDSESSSESEEDFDDKTMKNIIQLYMKDRERIIDEENKQATTEEQKENA